MDESLRARRRCTPLLTAFWGTSLLLHEASGVWNPEVATIPGYYSDAPVVTLGQENAYGWTQSYKAGVNGFNGTEILHLVAHRGSLFGTVGFWMALGFRPAMVVRLDSPAGVWAVDTVVYPFASRAESLKSVTWTTKANGAALRTPVPKLVVGFYLDFNGLGRCGMVVRNDATREWNLKWYFEERPYRNNYFSARFAELYKDSVTGVDRLFLDAGVPGVVSGVYDPNDPAAVRFPSSGTEAGSSFPTRPLAVATVGQRLYVGGGALVKRRNDGPQPSWSVIFDMSTVDDLTVDESVGGVRGLSAVPRPGGAGESLFFTYCPNGRSRSCMIRLDLQGDSFAYTEEACVKDMLKSFFGDTTLKSPYSLANYNFALSVPLPGGGVHSLIGLMALFYGATVNQHPTDPTQETVSHSGQPQAFYAGAGYLIRRSPSDYEMRIPGGPRFCPTEIDPRLVAVRCFAHSPFEQERDMIYLGGYDCNFRDATNTAWVLKGTTAAVHAEPLPALGVGSCTSTSTSTTSTVTTGALPRCQLCGLVSREAAWLSLYSVVDASMSEKVASYRKALDGNDGTWGGAETWVMDLAAVHEISSVRVDWRSCQCSSDGAVIMDRSIDGASWVTFATPTLHVWGEHLVRTYPVNAAARWLRISITEVSQMRYATIWEFGVLGFPSTSGPPRKYMPNVIAGWTEGGVAYTCQYAQEYASTPERFAQCREYQELWQEVCCVPSGSPTTPGPRPTPSTTTTAAGSSTPTPTRPTPSTSPPGPTSVTASTPTLGAAPNYTSGEPVIAIIQGSVDIVVTSAASFVGSLEVWGALEGFMASLAGLTPGLVTILSVRLKGSLEPSQPGGGSVVVDWHLEVPIEDVDDKARVVQKLLDTDLQEATAWLAEALAAQVSDALFDALVVRISIQGQTTTTAIAATMPPHTVPEATGEAMERVRLAVGVVSAAVLVFILACLAWLMVSKIYVLSQVCESCNAEVQCRTSRTVE